MSAKIVPCASYYAADDPGRTPERVPSILPIANQAIAVTSPPITGAKLPFSVVDLTLSARETSWAAADGSALPLDADTPVSALDAGAGKFWWLWWNEHAIDNVHDTVGGADVGGVNPGHNGRVGLGVLDVECSSLKRNEERCSVNGRNLLAVREVGGEGLGGNDMKLEDVGQVRAVRVHCQERAVVRSEHGERTFAFQCVNETCLGDRGHECAEVGCADC